MKKQLNYEKLHSINFVLEYTAYRRMKFLNQERIKIEMECTPLTIFQIYIIMK